MCIWRDLNTEINSVANINSSNYDFKVIIFILIKFSENLIFYSDCSVMHPSLEELHDGTSRHVTSPVKNNFDINFKQGGVKIATYCCKDQLFA